MATDKFMRIRKAAIRDVDSIVCIIERFAKEGAMLLRTKDEVYEHIRDYFVCEVDGYIIGTVSLHIDTEDLAEIRSLAVVKEYQKRGIGRAIVNECIKEAKSLNIKTVYTLTYLPDFFKRFNFTIINKDKLPQKVWKDCVRCNKFPNCDENAMIKII